MPGSKIHTPREDEDVIAAAGIEQTAIMSLRDAAFKLDVPKSTITDRMSGRVIHYKTGHSETILTAGEETRLAEYLIDLRKQGYSKSKEIVTVMATQMAVKHGKTVKGGYLGESWWQGFVKRNPQIAHQSSRNCSLTQTSEKIESIGLFYKGLLKIITNNEYGTLLGKPYLIFSADESVFDFDSINKIMAPVKGTQHVARNPNEQREKVTVLSCVSAFGASIPPMFISKSRSGLVSYGTQEHEPGASVLFSRQKPGWTDNDVYLKWFRKVFLPSIPAERPALLLVDGQKAHVTADFMEEARANKVIVVCRPGHSSRLLQPLNLSVFGPLKKGFTKAAAYVNHMMQPSSASDVVDKHNFAKVFNMAWCSAVTPELIRDGFRKIGIFPFNPQAFDYSKLAPRKASAAATQ